MTKEERLNRVKEFLNDHFESENNISDYGKDMLQGSVKNPYYVLLEGEYHGCYGSEGLFLSETELTDLVTQICGFDGEIGKQHLTAWDNITVLDIEKNK